MDYIRVASLSVNKVVDQLTISGPTTLHYTITVTNTGNVSLSNVVVNDPMISASQLVLGSGDTNLDGKLDITEVWTYSATYSVTQAMIDAGTTLVNIAVFFEISKPVNWLE